MILRKSLYQAVIASGICLGSISPGEASVWNSETTGGQWNDAASWVGGIPNAPDAVAAFSLTSTYTVNLVGGPFTIGRMEITSDSAALVINPGTIEFATSGGVPVLMFNTTRTNQPTMLTVFADLVGNQGLTINGTNRVGAYFRGDSSTLTGGININSAGNYINFFTPGALNGNTVTFNGNNNTLALGTVNTSANHTWTGGYDLRAAAASINSRTTGKQTLTGVITGGASNHLTFTGAHASNAAEFRLEGNNSYLGNTQIGSGANVVLVTATNANSLGQGAGSNVTVGNSGSSLRLESGVSITGKNLTLNGAGHQSEGSLRSLSGPTLWSGAVNVGTADNPTIGVDEGSLTLSGQVSGNKGLIKTGDGALILENTGNSFTGETVVEEGSLIVNGVVATSIGLTVKSGAFLAGTGAIQESVTLEAGATLSGGVDGSGTLSISQGDLSFATGAALGVVLDRATLMSNRIDLADDLILDLGHSTQLLLQEKGEGQLVLGTQFTLIHYEGSWNGGLFEFDGALLANESVFGFGGSEFRITYDFETIQGRAIMVEVIPEPSSMVMFAAGSLGMIGWFYRRRFTIVQDQKLSLTSPPSLL